MLKPRKLDGFRRIYYGQSAKIFNKWEKVARQSAVARNGQAGMEVVLSHSTFKIAL